MNFTVALLAGLVLLLPGITALVSWNFQSVNHGAKRPELQLTSLTALFSALGIAMVMHLFGYGLVSLTWKAVVELGQLTGRAFGPLIVNPYDMAVSVALGTGTSPPTTDAIAAFALIILFECLLAWRLIASEGLDLVMEPHDVRSQGWVFQHVVRPLRHGYRPIAYILTNTPHGEYGIGYEGVVADIRQGELGELKSISLAEPQRFIYQIIQARPETPRLLPHLTTHDRDWLGGIVVLDGSVIRNIVIQNVPVELIEAVEAVATPSLPEGEANSQEERA